MTMTPKCYACGSKRLTESKREVRRPIGSRVFTGSYPALACAACGEATADSRAVLAIELGIARELAEAGPRNGDEFKFLRKMTGLRAVEVAELLDVSAETVSRWENDKQALERRAVAIVAGLVLDRIEGRDETLQRLRALRDPRRLAKAVRVDLDEKLLEAAGR